MAASEFSITRVSVGILFVVAVLLSGAVMVFLWNSDQGHIVLPIAGLSYLFWLLGSCALTLLPKASADDSVDEMEISGLEPDMIHSYYQNLYINLNRAWTLFVTDYDATQSTLTRVGRSLIKATDLAKSTGMLALNAMLSAAKTGEVGRGFVTVSKDLVSISDQSAVDLRRLRQIVLRTESLLKHHEATSLRSLDTYLVQLDQLPLQSLSELLFHLQSTQKDLRMLAERYQRQRKHDVRWQQLAEAVRRLLNELMSTVYELELRLDDVLSDVRLLQLSGTLSGRQLLEIKDRNNTVSGMTE